MNFSPVTRTALKFTEKMGVLEYLKQHFGRCSYSQVAKELHIRENFMREITNFLLATDYITMKNGIIMSSSNFPDNLKDIQKLQGMPRFEDLYGIVEKYAKGQQLGFSHDQASFAFDIIRDDRRPFLDSTASELFKYIKTYADKMNLKVDSFLDAGCGPGDLTWRLHKLLGENVRIRGCDLSQIAITEAMKGTAKNGVLDFSVNNLSQLPKDWKYSVVLMFDVLHDLADPAKVMENVMRVLKDDGLLVILDPKVSSNILLNAKDLNKATMFGYSLLYCFPTSCSCNAQGIGWGYEKKEEFLKSLGLNVMGTEIIGKSLFNYAYFLRKNPFK